jgi:ABC-2 type transport system permease protein
VSARALAVRTGLQRGALELRRSLSNPQDVWAALFPAVVSLLVMYLLRGNDVPGTSFSLGAHSLPGILAMNMVLVGVMGLAMNLTTEREDGTLMRAKAIPHGVLGYLVGKVVTSAGMTLAALIVILAPAAALFDGLELGSARAWLTLAWVVPLGLLATLPLGAAIGALFDGVQSMSVVTLPLMGLVAVSGVFYPVTAFPMWLQWVAQAFPVYWLALGMRSALLPDAMVLAEIGESWRHVATIGILTAWAVIGMVLALAVLRRTARRETGSVLAARLERATRRTA